MFRIASFAAACGLVMASSPAAAQSVHEGYSHDPGRIVSYARLDRSDIDAGSEAGARVLLARIEAAAVAVCSGKAPPVTRLEIRDVESCRSDAVSGAVSRVGSPVLKRLANSNGRQLLAAR
jgi:UrcA family protein